MSKVIMFSKVFPKGHPKEGKETFFIQKIWKSIDVCLPVSEHHKIDSPFSNYLECEVHKLFAIDDKIKPKHHTIRSGNRFKVGDKFSPRIWRDKPYKSKQVIIADDIEIKQIFDFEMDENGIFIVDKFYLDEEKYPLIAQNDGLTQDEMFHWFMPNYDKPKSFKGQIICWNESVRYEPSYR